MPSPKNRCLGGLELKFTIIWGRFYDLFRKVCPFFVFIIVKCLCLKADVMNYHCIRFFYFLTFFSPAEIKYIKNNERIDDKYDSGKLTTERKKNY